MIFLILLSLCSFLSPAAQAFDSIELKQTLTIPAALKSFSPVGIAVDAQKRLWVSDAANRSLLLFSAQGDFVQSIGRAGTGEGEFQEPRGVAVDSQGQVYVADRSTARIQVFSPEGKFLLAFGEKGSGPGQLRNPTAITVSQDGVVIVADSGNSRLQLFSKDGVFLHTLDVGSDIAGLAVDPAGRLYVSNPKLRQIEQWSTAGQLLKSFTGGEPGVKAFVKPQALAMGSRGLLYVVDRSASSFRELDATGHMLGLFGRSGSGPGQFGEIEDIAVLDETVYICDRENKRIAILEMTRQVPVHTIAPVPTSRVQVSRLDIWPMEADFLALTQGGTLLSYSALKGELTALDSIGQPGSMVDLKKSLGLHNPMAMSLDTFDKLYFSDGSDHRVVKSDLKGTLMAEIGKSTSLFKSGEGELSKPRGVVYIKPGTVYVADAGNARIQAFNDQGLFLFTAGEKGSGPGQLKSPTGLAADKDRIYVSDPGNHKVSVFNGSGRFIRDLGLIGSEALVEPGPLQVDREGHLYVLDIARGRILVYDFQGVFLGGFASLGKGKGFLNRPRTMVLHEDGRLFVAEEGRIQSFKVVLLPPTPTGVKASPGDGFIQLRWDAVKTRFPVKYAVYRSTPSSGAHLVKETVDTTLSDDMLTPETTYSYTVVALSVQGAASVPSAPVLAMAKPGSQGPQLEIVSASIEDVYSAHYKYYGRVPLGHVVILNNGQAAFQKIKVSFAIQGYMDYPTETTLSELHSGEQKDVPLLATFNNRILEVTETTPIQAQVRVSFYQGLQENAVVTNLPFKLYSRNTIRWDRKDRFAAFVTPNDTPVLEFARGLVLPFETAHSGAPVAPAILRAWALYEGLGTYGLTYLPRPNNPYDRVSLDSTTVDSVQFARETMARKSGDCADVVALLASALESLTVTTCALDAPGHLFLMFDTGETDLRKLGFPEEMLVPYAGSFWIPLEATMVGSPFTEAWKKGAELYQQLSKSGKVTPIDIHLAWQTFEPATLVEIRSTVKPPERSAVEEKFLKDWKALVDLRWQTLQAAAREELAKNPKAGAPWLRLGLLAVEYRRYTSAREYFGNARADTATTAAALNNLGNLDYLAEDYEAAESHYKQAFAKDAEDPLISLNLVRVYRKRGASQKAARLYEQVISKNPSLKEQYPDVSAVIP